MPDLWHHPRCTSGIIQFPGLGVLGSSPRLRGGARDRRGRTARWSIDLGDRRPGRDPWGLWTFCYPEGSRGRTFNLPLTHFLPEPHCLLRRSAYSLLVGSLSGECVERRLSVVGGPNCPARCHGRSHPRAL